MRGIIIVFLVVISAFLLLYLYNIQTPEKTVQISVNPNSSSPISKSSVPILFSNDTKDMRVSTFERCPDIIDYTVSVKGTVLFEECGKNCLGGCPNRYCYYGINTTDGCLLYMKSRQTEFMGNSEVIFNNYDAGEVVALNGTISLYYSYYCFFNETEGVRYGEHVPICSYLIIGGL
jgi:hypothetical protein